MWKILIVSFESQKEKKLLAARGKYAVSEITRGDLVMMIGLISP